MRAEEVVHASEHVGVEAPVPTRKEAQRARLHAGGDPGGPHHHWPPHGAGRAPCAQLPDRIESENREDSNPKLRERARSLLSRRGTLSDQLRRAGGSGGKARCRDRGLERSLSEGRTRTQ